jgi:hypothetical protein
MQRQTIAVRLGQLEQQQKQLGSNAYVEQLAQDRLHMCLPRHTCYVIINPLRPSVKASVTAVPGTPWYERLWGSVKQADKPLPGQAGAR